MPRTESAVPRKNESFDIAFFLKHTGPPTRPPRELNGNRRSGKYRSGLKLFGSKRGEQDGRDSLLKDTPLQSFVPSEGVVQRVSNGGMDSRLFVNRTLTKDRQEVLADCAKREGEWASIGTTKKVGKQFFMTVLTRADKIEA